MLSRPTSHDTDSPGRALSIQPILLASLLASLAIGCGGASSDSDLDSGSRGTAGKAADEATAAVQNILDRYVKASSYSDVAQITLKYKVDGREFDEPASITVRFRRPNRVWLEIKRGINVLRLVCDGKQMWTTIEDPVTGNLGGQTVQVAAPERLSTSQIYSATELVDPSQPDEALSALFGMPVSLEVSQVGLLLDGLALRHLLTNATEVKRLDDQQLDGVECQRFRLTSVDGNFTFWWDARQTVLRRIEYPIKGLQAQIPEGATLEDVQFQADFENARFDPLPDSAFTFQPAQNATLVRFFVLPPLQLPTSKYGEIIPNFDLTKLDGAIESSRTWSGKLRVLTWFHDHPTSRAFLPQMQKVMQQQDADGVVFRAVFTEGVDAFSDDKLRALINEWGLAIPVLRDLDVQGRDLLEITDAPTTVVLDDDNRLHAFIVGASPQLEPTLTTILRRLKADENVAADVQQRVVAEQTAFAKQLSMARITVDPTDAPSTPIAAASQPQRLAKTQLWRTEEIESPGNSIVLANDGGYRCIVLDGLRQVVELDDAGTVVARNELPIDNNSGVSRLRTAIDGQGRRFYLGFVQFGEQLHLFDEGFKLLLTYPDTSQRQARVLDAQIIDLDEDGQLEIYVGFADPVGLHRVSLQGKREWSNRATPGVVSVVPRWLARPTYLLTTGDDGTIRAVSAAGREGPSISVKNRLVHQLAVSQSRQSRTTQFIGMAFTVEGRLIAVGLDPQLQEAWSYGLPAGTYASQVETPISAQMLSGDGYQWIFAGPDGSIHIVSDDGGFFDYFNTGQQVTGISADHSSGGGRLIVSSLDHVTAYELREP